MEPIAADTTEFKGKQRPLVSIITPTYNHEKFIRTCIESVLRQTYENWEMIIIDDGSTDKTGSIVLEYQDKRIRYVKQENVGIWKLKETYNKALKLSKGDLIAILEGDDAWPYYKLEKQVKIFQENDIIFSWGRKNTINDENKVIAFDLPSLKGFKNISLKEMTRNLIVTNFIQPCTVMIDKNALLSIGGFIQDEITPYVDYPTFLELSLRGRFYPSDKVMGYWRKHKAQITTEKESDMNQAFMVSVDFYEKLSKTLQKSIEFKMDDKLEFQDNIIKDQIAVSARLALIKGNWKEASRNYKNIIKNSTLKIKIQSILGIICAYLRITLEWFAVLTCKPKIRDVGGEWDSTLFKNENNKTFMFKIQFAILKILIFIKPSKYPDSKDLIVNELEI